MTASVECISIDQFLQPRSQGLSSLPPLSFLNDNGGREKRPWERGCNSQTLSDQLYEQISTSFACYSIICTHYLISCACYSISWKHYLISWTHNSWPVVCVLFNQLWTLSNQLYAQLSISCVCYSISYTHNYRSVVRVIESVVNIIRSVVSTIIDWLCVL